MELTRFGGRVEAWAPRTHGGAPDAPNPTPPVPRLEFRVAAVRLLRELLSNITKHAQATFGGHSPVNVHETGTTVEHETGTEIRAYDGASRPLGGSWRGLRHVSARASFVLGTQCLG